MTVSFRAMGPKDVNMCVEGIAAHPVLGPRYGSLVEQLPFAIRSTLGCDSLIAFVIEELQNSVTRFLGAAMAVFVRTEFLQEFKTAPLFWVGPELVRRMIRGDSPLLSNAEVRAANSTVGLNLLIWHNTIHPADLRRAEVGTLIMSALEEKCRGFYLRELIGQADCREHLHVMLNAGGLYFRRLNDNYGEFADLDDFEFGREPRHAGMSREVAFCHSGSWLGSLFLYAAPHFCFRRSEQRLLTLALDGGTDGELSDELGISLFAVKKTWRSIYDRVFLCHPQLIPCNSNADAPTPDRGKQKKQRLLAYLRRHPEELRPVSRKLIESAYSKSRLLTIRDEQPASLRNSLNKPPILKGTGFRPYTTIAESEAP